MSCPSVVTYVLGAHENFLIGMFLLSIHNICLVEKSNFDYVFLSRGLVSLPSIYLNLYILMDYPIHIDTISLE